MLREDLIKLAREAVAGSHRTLADGSTETRLPAHRDPASFDPPEWVIEAMQRAYNRGRDDGNRAGAGLYPEGG